jgi:hypothetical protein
LQDPPEFTQIVIFGLKIYLLATLEITDPGVFALTGSAFQDVPDVGNHRTHSIHSDLIDTGKKH